LGLQLRIQPADVLGDLFELRLAVQQLPLGLFAPRDIHQESDDEEGVFLAVIAEAYFHGEFPPVFFAGEEVPSMAHGPVGRTIIRVNACGMITWLRSICSCT